MQRMIVTNPGAASLGSTQPLEGESGDFAKRGELLVGCAAEQAILSAEIEADVAAVGLLFLQQEGKATQDVRVNPALFDSGGPAEFLLTQRETQPGDTATKLELVVEVVKWNGIACKCGHSLRDFHIVTASRDALGAHKPHIVGQRFVGRILRVSAKLGK